MHCLSLLSLDLRPVVICLHLQEEYVCLRLHIPSLPIWARRKLSPSFNTAPFHPPIITSSPPSISLTSPATEAIYHCHGTIHSFDRPRQHPGSCHRTKWHRHRHWHRFTLSFRDPESPLPIPQRHPSHRPNGYQPLLHHPVRSQLSCP